MGEIPCEFGGYPIAGRCQVCASPINKGCPHFELYVKMHKRLDNKKTIDDWGLAYRTERRRLLAALEKGE